MGRPPAHVERGAPVEKFQQLDASVPTPSAQRIASGAPGTAYWQNRADYDIAVELDDVKCAISAEATVTYHNHSPDARADEAAEGRRRRETGAREVIFAAKRSP